MRHCDIYPIKPQVARRTNCDIHVEAAQKDARQAHKHCSDRLTKAKSGLRRGCCRTAFTGKARQNSGLVMSRSHWIAPPYNVPLRWGEAERLPFRAYILLTMRCSIRPISRCDLNHVRLSSSTPGFSAAVPLAHQEQHALVSPLDHYNIASLRAEYPEWAAHQTLDDIPRRGHTMSSKDLNAMRAKQVPRGNDPIEWVKFEKPTPQ